MSLKRTMSTQPLLHPTGAEHGSDDDLMLAEGLILVQGHTTRRESGDCHVADIATCFRTVFTF